MELKRYVGLIRNPMTGCWEFFPGIWDDPTALMERLAHYFQTDEPAAEIEVCELVRVSRQRGPYG